MEESKLMADLPIDSRRAAIIPKGPRTEYLTHTGYIEHLTSPHPNASDIPGMHPEAASALDEHYSNQREHAAFMEAELQRNYANSKTPKE